MSPGPGVVHPANDVRVTWCSRCRCPPDAHAFLASATALAEGNDAFETGAHERAVLCYTRALASQPGDAAAALYCNRAAAELALRRWPAALHDAERAQRLEPRWAKPRARAAAALDAMGQARLAAACACSHQACTLAADASSLSAQHEAACRAWRAALKLEPDSAVYAAGLAASQRAAAAAAKNKPIAADAAPSSEDCGAEQRKACGDAAAAKRDWRTACREYTAALAARPGDGASSFIICVAHSHF